MKEISFEEYKKEIQEWETRFYKDQKGWKGTNLEKIKRDYDTMMIGIEDAKYLEPIKQNTFHEIIAHYSQINQVLQPIEIMNTQENIELQILVLPSFSHDYQLLFTKNTLFYNYISGHQKKCEIYSLNEIDDHNLSTDVITFIENAKKPKGNTMILDGVVFYFLFKKNNELKIAHTHSPHEESPTGILVERIENLLPIID